MLQWFKSQIVRMGIVWPGFQNLAKTTKKNTELQDTAATYAQGCIMALVHLIVFLALMISALCVLNQ